VSRPVAVGASAVPLLLLMVVGLRYIRDVRPLTLLAFAGVAGRLGTYHTQLDNVMLIFLVVALWTTRHTTHSERLRRMAIVIVGTLLLPWRLVATPAAQACINAIWVMGAMSLWRAEQRNAPAYEACSHEGGRQ
jgi:hypothetical protein